MKGVVKLVPPFQSIYTTTYVDDEKIVFDLQLYG
jgi:hypothetical protein